MPKRHAVATPLLEITGLTKGFPGVKALDAVDFVLHRGEIHALMGENGAGKSTLMKILSGAYKPDPGGEIRIEGKPVRIDGPLGGRSAGISQSPTHCCYSYVGHSARM